MLKWIIFGGLLLQSFAYALTDEEIVSKVKLAVTQRHIVQPPEWWRELGSNAPAAIIDLYKKTKRSDHRLRMLHGLGSFEDPAAAEFLKEQATSSDEDVVRYASLSALGKSNDENTVAFLSQFLSHEDQQTRKVTIDSLKDLESRLKSSKARVLLSDYAQKETNKWLTSRTNETKKEEKSGDSLFDPQIKAPAFDPRGTWLGFWLIPDTKSSGMEAQVAELIISGVAGKFSGNLVLISNSGGVPAAPKRHEILVNQIEVIDGAFKGTIQDSEFGTQAFRGEWIRSGEHTTLNLVFPGLGATFSARYQSAEAAPQSIQAPAPVTPNGEQPAAPTKDAVTPKSEVKAPSASSTEMPAVTPAVDEAPSAQPEANNSIEPSETAATQVARDEIKSLLEPIEATEEAPAPHDELRSLLEAKESASASSEPPPTAPMVTD